MLSIPTMGGDFCCFKVVYAVQSPMYLALTPLQSVAVGDGCGEPLHRWKCNFAAHGTAADLEDFKPADIWYHGACCYEGGVFVSSSQPRVPVQAVVCGDQRVARGSERVRSRSRLWGGRPRALAATMRLC